ncbi:hypothetical protein I5M27_12930 [Adhaeribacter sp. BT258]|uniref:Ribbon-helix-helix protein, copG family n=1 Tax=Adhaeribacter terrigena TaxID=2793070 RepID=A0ABS1C3F3_9BACT|nr:DUF6364 family protein [Adhaeribacter terrigena]MBK0403892.1 hypothetical protein [Adhaeribacter terrigena]
MAEAENPGAEKVKLNIQMEKELLEKGKEHARKKGISFAGLIRQLLIEDMEKVKA